MAGPFPVIGIAGPSCSGKSTIADRLAERLKAKHFCLDDYWIKNAEPIIVNGHKTRERPSQYAAHRLLEDIRQARRTQVVVVEGFLIFTYMDLLAECNLKVFLHLHDDQIVYRRRLRAAGMGRKPEAVEASFLAHGIEEWRRYGAAQKEIPGVTVLDGSWRVEHNLAEIMRRIDMDTIVELNAERWLAQQKAEETDKLGLQLRATQDVLLGYKKALQGILQTACGLTDLYTKEDIDSMSMTADSTGEPVLLFRRTGRPVEETVSQIFLNQIDDHK